LKIDLVRIAARAMEQRGFLPWPPPAVLDEAKAASTRGADDGSVRDLRELPWSSIDNVESRDLDQIEALDGGRLFVGIADVDHFVPRKSQTDGFAGHNTTSVYTGVKVFPMLPETLSEHASSLLPDGERLAIVMETEIHPDGTLGDTQVYRARVVNYAKLAYPHVSEWLDGKAPPPKPLDKNESLRKQVEAQDALAQKLAAARRRAGALDVDTAETRAVIDASGRVVGMEAHHQDRAGRVIEELMIASNRGVSRALDAKGVPSIRRVVREPERWERIVHYAGDRGHHLPAAPSAVELAKFVEKMRSQTTPEEFAEVSVSIIKMMGRGEYVAHIPGQKEICHFGLATMEYTHATAPNRRYCDLIVQRLLKNTARYSADELRDIATHCSEQEVAAQKVERQVRKSAAAQLLSTRIGETFEGIVTGASEKGVWVKVLHPAVEGKVVEGDSGLRVGDKVRIKLVSVDVERGYIDFACH
jgi:exoribonuclease II